MSANKQILGLLILQTLCAMFAFCQPKGKIEFYSTEQGLSHQRVTCITKDREGFMWFGSWDGINRFDGHEFISYKSSPGDSSQLKNDRIDQIVEDDYGRLWIVAYDNQVYRFDKKTERFSPLVIAPSNSKKNKIVFTKILAASNGFVWLQTAGEGLYCVPQNSLSGEGAVHFSANATAHHRLPSNTIHFFYQDRERRIWVGTSDGLVCLVQTKNSFQQDPISFDKRLSNVNVTAFEEDAAFLYFSTASGDLIRFEKQAKQLRFQRISYNRINGLRRSKINDLIYASTSKGELLEVALTSNRVRQNKYPTGEPLHYLFEDRAGNLWLEPDKNGIILFSPAQQSFRRFTKENKGSLNTVGNRFGVTEDGNGTVWINMKGGNFGYYNQQTQDINYSLVTPDAASRELPKNINTLFYDPAGVLWFTTYERDLVKIILQGNEFQQRLMTKEAFSVSDNEVRGVLQDNQNRLWLGAKNGKLSVFQNGLEQTGLLINEPPTGLGVVYCIMQDREGNIWLGTKGKGLYKASPVDALQTKYRLTHFPPDKNNPDGLPGHDIYALLEDRQGRIWIGSFDNGLSYLLNDGKQTKFVHVEQALTGYPKDAFRKVRHLALDTAGNLWVATTDGLLTLRSNDERGSTFTCHTYFKVPGNKESLGNNDVQFIHRDAKGRMWLATSGGGFAKVTTTSAGKELAFKNYTTRNGMPNDYVLSCAEDRQGNLWIATENGLVKFNPETETFRNYDAYEGLPKASFSEAAASRSPVDGRLVFGTTAGFLSFHPERIGNNRIPANIAFTNLRINNEDVGPQQNGNTITENVNYFRELRLNHDQNIISIAYSILDHRAGSRQAFAYRLVGFDSAWHDDRQLQRATYTNLPPGNYLFEVKSSSTDLYSNAPSRQLRIVILPPWWKTWWAYTLYVIMVGIVLFFIRRNALAMIRLRNKIVVEQKLAELKLNFFTNVSHELRTPLTLIVNPLEQLARKEKLSAEGISYVDVARKNAARMVRFINQLLDLRKVQSEKAALRISRVEVLAFIKSISDHFKEAARAKRIKLDVTCIEAEVIAWIDAEKLDVVLYNVLGNALKFTPEGRVIQVRVGVLQEKGCFQIAVHDQGTGVATEKLETIFDLFQEGSQPDNRELKGTGIGLALAKEFVELHGGKIWAANNADGGLTVTIELKLGTEHYIGANHAFVEAPKVAPVYHSSIEQQLLPLAGFASPAQTQESPLVLLVEDNHELRSFLKNQLGEFYRVETARDGQEGFEKAIGLVPDLIISDIMMPVMDGIALLDKVKNDTATSHIPVVLLSAKHSIESQIEGLRYGADCYITKPFNSDHLVAAVDNLLAQRKRLFEALVEKKQGIDLSPSPVMITSRDEAFLKEAIEAVEAKMADVDFNVEILAASMAMHPKTFYKKFKSLTGFVPVEFIRDMRLQRAAQLLSSSAMNVSEVAYEVGFSNPKYFSTCFKEKYHVSPAEFQKPHKAAGLS